MATRSEFYKQFGLTNPIISPILEAAFAIEEEQIWRENLFNSPHGEKWHTSFHASSFPGDDPKACGRKAMYGLMNIPSDKPVNMAGRLVMEAGKAIEESIVWRFSRAGLLITDSPESKHQKGYVVSEYWLTGSPDAVINLPKKNRPHPIEIKSKDHEVVELMKRGKRSFDEAHRNQLLTYIGIPKYKDGTLLYVSRNRPSITHEFKFDYSENFMTQGFAKLGQWKENFLEEKLPERPKEWKWTESPCRFCPVKRFCKQDVKEKVETLKESNAITHAKDVYNEYDYDKTRQEVLNRWE